MRKIYIKRSEGDKEIILGTGKEIKRLFNSIWKASHKGNCDYKFWGSDRCKFNPDKIYGLEVSSDYVWVWTEHDVTFELLIGGDWYAI